MRTSVVILTLLALAALALILVEVSAVEMGSLGYQVAVTLIASECALLAISGFLSIYFMKRCQDANMENLS